MEGTGIQIQIHTFYEIGSEKIQQAIFFRGEPGRVRCAGEDPASQIPEGFCGNKESDNWVLLHEAGWLVEDNEELQSTVKNILSSLTPDDIKTKKTNAQQISKDLNTLVKQSYDTIASWAK